MISWFRLALAWCAIAAISACGDSSGARDAGVDGSDAADDGQFQFPDGPDGNGTGLTCRNLERKAGPAVVTSEVSQLLAAGIDLGPAAQMEIDTSNLLMGFEMLELDDPSGFNDDALSVAFELQQDLDGDEEDNFSGSEPLCIEPAALGDSDEPVTQLTSSIADGHLHGETDLLFLPPLTVGIVTPEFQIHAVVLDATVQADLAGFSTGVMTGALWASDLLPLTILGLDLLELLTCGGLLVDPIPLQIDVDGDGLEVITCDDTGAIASCTDYDPTTGEAFVTDGEDCPAMLADGFAFSMSFEAVSFVIEGVLVP